MFNDLSLTLNTCFYSRYGLKAVYHMHSVSTTNSMHPVSFKIPPASYFQNIKHTGNVLKFMILLSDDI